MLLTDNQTNKQTKAIEIMHNLLCHGDNKLKYFA